MKKSKILILLITVFLIICSQNLFAQQFTIAVISDTQNYVDYRRQKNSKPRFRINFSDVYQKQIDYILENINRKKSPIKFAIHLGDNVLHQSYYMSEWELADSIISGLDGKIPFGMVPGNHDYDFRKDIEFDDGSWYPSFYGGSYFTNFFGSRSDHFKGKEWYVDSFNDGMDSAIVFEVADGINFLFLGLEMEAGDAALQWAQNVIDKYKGMPTILVTHEFLTVYKKDGTNTRSGSKYRRDYDYNTPTKIFNKFITKNNQIFMVLCGHSYDGNKAEGYRIDNNKDGYPVYQLLSDYEGRTQMFKKWGRRAPDYGGDGWMRLMNFDLKNKTCEIQTYSPQLQIYETDKDSSFTIDFDWDWDARFNK